MLKKNSKVKIERNPGHYLSFCLRFFVLCLIIFFFYSSCIVYPRHRRRACAPGYHREARGPRKIKKCVPNKRVQRRRRFGYIHKVYQEKIPISITQV